jgi:DNA repair protein RadC
LHCDQEKRLLHDSRSKPSQWKPLPSQTDIDITRRLAEAGELLGIKVLDHIIIGDGTYVSLKEKMLL